MTSAVGFLSPYRVLDITDERGLLAGRLLADLGADVIQLEPPEGSSARSCPPLGQHGSHYWESYARNKRGVTCNLALPPGRDLFLGLIRNVDFLIDTHSQDHLATIGLSWDDLKEVNPSLIQASITGFGQRGPKADAAHTDLTIWAAGGALYGHRQGVQPPVRTTVPQAFLLASCDAAAAALVAHFERLHTGRGTFIDVAAQQSVAWATLGRALAFPAGDRQDTPARVPDVPGTIVIDTSLSGSATGHSKWPVKDGYLELHLAIGAAGGPWTNRFVKWLLEQDAIDRDIAETDWTYLPDKMVAGTIGEAFFARARKQVGEFLRGKYKEDILRAALEHRFIAAPILSPKDLAESLHLADRDFWFKTNGANPTTSPGRFAVTTPDGFVMSRPAPRLGEHNTEIYSSLGGLEPERLEQLKSQGVV